MELMASILGGELRETDPIPYTTALAGPLIDATGQTSSTVRVEDVTEARLKFGGAPIISELPMDDLEFRDIVAEFVDRLKEQLNAMATAADAGDFEELARLAHWLKGSGGTAGFPVLTQPAVELERQAMAAERDRVFVSIECLRVLTDRIYRPEPIPLEPAN
jgi:HPt (histidine-containing phosphotransfer) domain-containing protein